MKAVHTDETAVEISVHTRLPDRFDQDRLELSCRSHQSERVCKIEKGDFTGMGRRLMDSRVQGLRLECPVRCEGWQGEGYRG
jgi:hypothetical protein